MSRDGDGPKRSRADYLRKRRAALTDEEKAAGRKRNMERMRASRGSQKPFREEYLETLASMSEPQRTAAMLLMETPRDTCLEGSLTVGLAEIVGQIAPDESGAKQRATKGTRVSKVAPPPSVGDVIIPTASIETIERLSLSAEAVKNRYNAAIAHFEKQVLREASNPKLRQEGSLADAAEMARARAWTGELRKHVEERERATNVRRARSRENRTNEQRQADKARKRQTRKRRTESELPGPFVAVDAEGVDIGEPFEVIPGDPKLDFGLAYDPASADAKLMAQDHATFLWGAGDAANRRLWLGSPDKRALNGIEILEWLTRLPEAFGENAIFVMFAASYDWTQIIRHMPPHKQWELWKGIPWPKHLSDDEWPLPDDYKDEKSNPIRYVLWGKYALSLLPGKRLRIGRLRDPNRHRDAKGQWDFASKPITIYDSFGFFQMKFTEAVSGYGEGVLTPAEFTRLELGKNRRPAMGEIPFPEIVDYTSIELGALARIMEINRHAIKGLGLELNAWYGAGVIANAMMMKYRVRAYYPDIVQKELPEPQRWAHQAFFGGRIELVKQGTHEPRFFNYDISSAYPHILRHLPNMAGNEWRHWDAEQLLTAGYSDDQPISGRWRRTSNEIDQILAAIDGFSAVSMVRVKFSFCDQRRYIGQFESGEVRLSFAPVPWYPLPIRDVDGSIYFPSYGHGIYCVEEIRAALRWAKRIYEHARADEKPQIALAEAWQFIPINDAKPFGFIVEIFKRRARIDAQNKEAKAAWLRNGMHGPEPYDATEKILKLGMNSVYGKTAQAVGSDVPKTANPFFAAAVTAGTRAMMVDASSADPDAIIAFATDGIFSVRELPLKPVKEKLLGEWELKQRSDGMFVQSGVYTFEDYHAAALPTDEVPKRTSKTRGIRPAGLPTGKTAAQFLVEAVPEAWRKGEPAVHFEYRAYKTIGAAIASRASCALAGHWITGTRRCAIEGAGSKRQSAGISGGNKRARDRRLIDTLPADNPMEWRLSEPRSPEWLNVDLGERGAAETDALSVAMKGGYD